MVLWPEGTTYDDPMTDPSTTGVFDYVSRQMDAPLIAQGVSERNSLHYNTAVLWQAGKGVLDFYDKKHPVPFGEYIPDREFWRQFAPDLIDLIQREYTPGSTDNVFESMARSSGSTSASISSTIRSSQNRWNRARR